MISARSIPEGFDSPVSGGELAVMLGQKPLSHSHHQPIRGVIKTRMSARSIPEGFDSPVFSTQAWNKQASSCVHSYSRPQPYRANKQPSDQLALPRPQLWPELFIASSYQAAP